MHIAAYHRPSEIQSVTVVFLITAWVTFLLFAVVTVAVTVVLVAKKVLVWAEAVINMRVEGLVIGARVDLAIIVLTVVAIALEFAVTMSYSVDVVVGILIDGLTDVTICSFYLTLLSTCWLVRMLTLF